MSHTLSILDGVTGSTLTLAGTSATGYQLMRRTRTMPDLNMQRNSSLYADGEIPVSSRRMNVTEEITLSIVGSSMDDLFIKLRALEAACEHARDYMQQPGMRQPTYIIDQPQGVTNAAYSILINGRVDEPEFVADDPEDDSGGDEGTLLAYEMANVKLTIEREPFWRETAPALSTTITNWAPQQATITPKADFGRLDISSVPGDIPALCRLHLIPTSAGNYTRTYLGYRSQARGGSAYNTAGVVEVEGGVTGTDTTTATDSSASPGSGTTKLTVSFAAYANYANRVTIAPSLSYGSYRVFARVKASVAGNSFGMYLQYMNGTATVIPSTPAVTFTPAVATWAMVDLGVITNPVAAGSELLYTVANTPISFNFWISRISGAGTLDVDCLFFLPVDEYAIIAPAGSGTYPVAHYAFDNIMPHPLGSVLVAVASGAALNSVQASGELMLPPGNGSLYYITTDANYNNVFTTATGRFVLTLYRCARYTTVRGNT